MSTTCPPLESLAEVLRLDPDDPRRRHLEECPRCRARVAAFRSFMEMEPIPAGANREDARRRLDAAIHAGVGPHEGRAASHPSTWWQGLLRPAWRPALGLAVAVLLTVVLVRGPADRGRLGEMMLRGAGPGAQVTAVPTATWSADGSVALRWPAVAGADGYRVLIYNQDLEEIAQLEAGRESTLTVSAGQLAGLTPARAALFWRVAALQHGDPTSVTAPATLRLP